MGYFIFNSMLTFFLMVQCNNLKINQRNKQISTKVYTNRRGNAFLKQLNASLRTKHILKDERTLSILRTPEFSKHNHVSKGTGCLCRHQECYH